MLLDEAELEIIQRWFDAIETVAPEFLKRFDWELGAKIKAMLAKIEEPKP
jgi:hypothetical protein